MDRLLVVICTHNRPKLLMRFLDSILASLGSAPTIRLDLLIIDDSSQRFRLDTALVRARLAGHPVRFVLVGAAEYDELLVNIRQMAPALSATACDAIKRPGTSGWSPGGARNLGFLYGATVAQGEPVLFIDDDIVFGEAALTDGRLLKGHTFAEVLTHLLSQAASPRCRAVGVRFLGCPDLSLMSHLEFMLDSLVSEHATRRQLSLSLLSEFPQYEPTVTQLSEADVVSASAYRGPGGISAGVMLVGDGLTLSEAPQPTCYNEDWIWLESIRSDQGALRRADVVVPHLAEHYEFEQRQLSLQERGELLYDAIGLLPMPLNAMLQLLPPLRLRVELVEAVSIAINERATRVAQIRNTIMEACNARSADLAGSVKSTLGQLDALLDSLEDELNDRLIEEVADIGIEWITSVSGWRALCSMLRNHREILPQRLRF